MKMSAFCLESDILRVTTRRICIGILVRTSGAERAFRACLALHMPRFVTLVGFFSILLAGMIHEG